MTEIMAIYINPWLLALAIIIVVAFIVFAVYITVKTYRKKAATGRDSLIGRTAIVRTTLNPRGDVFIEDELWSAVIDKGKAEPDEEVIVIKVEGLKLIVTKK